MSSVNEATITSTCDSPAISRRSMLTRPESNPKNSKYPGAVAAGPGSSIGRNSCPASSYVSLQSPVVSVYVPPMRVPSMRPV
jgi:hypothetical protein